MKSSTWSLAGVVLAGFILATSSVAAESNDASARAVTNDPVERSEAGITVAIDPRVELVAVTQHLSGYAERSQRFKGRINDFDHPYLNALRQHFAGFKEHEAIKRLAALRVGGSDPMGIAVQLSDPNDVALQGALDREIVGSEPAEVDAYVAALRTFARDAAFMDFYTANAASRAAMVEDFKQSIDLHAIATETGRYCGAQPARYTIILAPLLGRTSFGPNVTTPDGTKVFYAILPASGVADGHLVFGNRNHLDEYLWHEFGHSFVNPLVDEHWRDLEKLSGLMNKIQPSRSLNYGREWKIWVSEHVVRAIAARIVRQQKGETAYAEQVARDQGRGFAYLGELCRSLETYEQNRDKFPSLSSYFPEIVAVFERLNETAAKPQAS
ncbi:DUF4932 domain-containing protein [Opitutus terrae]|uniref:DUF4932 domain-containing protein n=1 Tax=Opitutus terrae (strain DSM 11246 / JCM 15787 / PB90-1) TaxID=452637 RepID=B1ZPV3_OPITP|nr:DUF4932 domain-containing protein [Opitutus terrae]ACB75556.1 hypothetical protein Oter_2274 [Opitutus terrae PB90-1]